MKKFVSWKEVEDYINNVAKFYNNFEITGVYGIPRGGLILAVMLSHKMNIPLLQAPYDNCIIIDDISDSGESLLHYANNSSGNSKLNYHITTMYFKKGSLVKPEYYLFEKENKWIVYPWEVK